MQGFLDDKRVQVVAACDVNRETPGYWDGAIAGREPARVIVEWHYARLHALAPGADRADRTGTPLDHHRPSRQYQPAAGTGPALGPEAGARSRRRRSQPDVVAAYAQAVGDRSHVEAKLQNGLKGGMGLAAPAMVECERCPSSA